MRAGLLNRHIVIQKPTTTKNTYGEESEEWVDYHSCKAYIPKRSGSRKMVVVESTQVGTIEMQIRKTKDIDETMRVFYQDKYYKIAYVDYINEDRTYKITADLIQM